MKTRIITIIAALLSLTAGQAADRLQIEDITLKPGEEKEFKLSLSLDQEKYAGVQFDIQLPTGLSLGMNNSEVYYAFSGSQAADLSCQVSKTGENTYKFMVYSNSLELLKNGELMTLRLKAEKDITQKDYMLQLNDMRLSDINGTVTKLGNSTITVKVMNSPKGDANGDGMVNANDSVEIMNYIMGSPSNSFMKDSADANKDGSVNAADIVWIVNYILSN